jgi:hypothetical protein
MLGDLYFFGSHSFEISNAWGLSYNTFYRGNLYPSVVTLWPSRHFQPSLIFAISTEVELLALTTPIRPCVKVVDTIDI